MSCVAPGPARCCPWFSPWMGRLPSMERKSNVPMIVLTVAGLAFYAVGTYVVVEVAGGTHVSSADSNTPNATVPGPPDFK